MQKIGLYVLMVLLFQGCNVGKSLGNVGKSLGVVSSDKTVIEIDKKLEWVNSTSAALIVPSKQIYVRYAEGYCKKLSYNNKTDWRLPSVYELQSSRDVIANFTEGIRNGAFWSSTSPKDKPKNRYAVQIFNLLASHSYIGGRARNSVLCTRDLTSSDIEKTSLKKRTKTVKSNLRLKNPSENACIQGGGEVYGGGKCRGNLQEGVQVCRAMGLRIPSLNELDTLATSCGATFTYNGKGQGYRSRKAYLKSSYNSCVRKKGMIEQYIWTNTSTKYGSETYDLVKAEKFQRGNRSNMYIQCVK